MRINSRKTFWLQLSIVSIISIFHILGVNGQIEMGQDHFDKKDYYHRIPIRFPIPDNKQLCGRHLRYAISTMCKRRGFFDESGGTNLDTESFNVNQNNDTVHIPDESTEPGRQLGVITEGHTVLRRLPRHVVDECCDRPCKEEAMMKYCNLFRHKHVTGRVNSNYDSAGQPLDGSFDFVGNANLPGRSSSLQQNRQGRHRPWKTIRRHKNALTSGLNIRKSREDKKNNRFAVLSFFLKFPHPISRQHQKKISRNLHPLADNNLRNNAATNPENELVSISGIYDMLLGFIPPASSAIRDTQLVSHVAASLPIEIPQWPMQRLLPRLLKTRDTYQIPIIQQASNSYPPEGTPSRHRTGNFYLHQGPAQLEDHTIGVKGEHETHHTHYHQSRNTKREEQEDRSAHFSGISTSTTEESAKSNVYVFPIGIHDEILGHKVH